MALALTAAVTAQDYQPAPFLNTALVARGRWHAHDINGNGQPDLVIDAEVPEWGVFTILDPGLTTSTGTVNTVFRASSVGFTPIEVIGFADMNNDTREDIVIEMDGVFFPSEVFYLPGDGRGGFGAPVFVATVNSSVTTTALGDFDGNGQTDFVFTDGAVNIVLQTNGRFQQRLSIPAFPRAIVAGDFNGDGADDLAINDNGTLIVQPGGATFGTRVTFPCAPGLSSGYAQDLDLDGRDDLVLQVGATAPWLVNVFFGSATTMLTGPTDVIPGGGPNGSDSLAPFDLDGDGRDELVANIRSSPGYFVIRQDGARNFSPQPYGTTMTGALIDLDLDGDLDLLQPDAAASGYHRLENRAIYGAACNGAAGTPRLRIGSPIPGNTAFDIAVANAAPSAMVALFITAAGQPGRCGLQVDLGQQLVPGLIGMSSVSGVARYQVPLPRDLPAGPYFLQGAVLDPSGAFNLNGLALAMTGGRTLRVY